MISVNNLSVQFTGTDLFKNVTFNIADHDRVGLVGMNGAGKSTLLKVLCGWQEPESGTLVMASGQTVGYLPQEMVPDAVGTVIDEALTAFSQLDELEREQERLTQEIAERTDYESDEYTRLLERHNDVTEHLSMLGGGRRREAAEKVLLGLGFRHDDFERPVAVFSGGWQMRVELAKLLLRHPDFLLLDEPTNHLDIESIQWLEGYLQSYTGAVVLVSHDRTFLDNITKRTIEITAGRIYDYKCPYSEYVVQMQERRASQMAQLTNQQRQVAQIEAFIERFRYKATKAKQVQSRVKMLERMEKIAVNEVSTESIHFQFPPAPHSGKIVVECNRLGRPTANIRCSTGWTCCSRQARKWPSWAATARVRLPWPRYWWVTSMTIRAPTGSGRGWFWDTMHRTKLPCSTWRRRYLRQLTISRRVIYGPRYATYWAVSSLPTMILTRR